MYLMAIGYLHHDAGWFFCHSSPPHTMLKYQKPSFGDSTSTYIKPETQNLA